MRLFEFDSGSGSAIAKIVIAADQLKDEAKAGKLKDWDVDKLLNYFQDYDIILDRTDLYDMIKRPPLKSLIKNIKGDEVVWTGQEETATPEPTETEKTIQQMAKKALKR